MLGVFQEHQIICSLGQKSSLPETAILSAGGQTSWLTWEACGLTFWYSVIDAHICYYTTSGHTHSCPLSLIHPHMRSPSPSHCSHSLSHAYTWSHSIPDHAHTHSPIHIGLKWHVHTTHPGPQTRTRTWGFLLLPLFPTCPLLQLTLV